MEAVLLYVFQLAFFLVFNIMKYRSITTDGNYLFDYTIFFVVMGIYSIFNYYQYIATEIAWYNTEGQTSEKKERIKDFIERLVPKHVTQQLNSADGSIGSEYKNVTLLYADIVGFTAYCSGRNTKEVFQMLSRLFTAFDKECNALELYKVYTIGDCYVVMSFLDAHKRYEPEEEAADVVEFGFSMIEIIAKVRKEVNFDGLHMRIGIHTGKIYGGIVGTDIIRFDMYGSDVLIANKLESSGAQDKIHISQATKDLLDLANQDKRYRFTPDHVLTFNKFTPAREIMTYFIDRNVNDGDKA
jgi:class 3 adenylate cyclase